MTGGAASPRFGNARAWTPHLPVGQNESVVSRPLEMKRAPSWKLLAACRGVEADIFYPLTDEEAESAKSVCQTCSVREACLEWALAHRERDGVWGGATERERRRMVRQRRRSA